MTNYTTTSNEHSSGPVSTKTSPVAKALLKSITLYQRLTSGRPSPCRFYPSCSNYAVEAVEVHGAVRGTGLALRRLSRCRPLGPHGVDLVPEPKKARSTKS
jgi:putative membrane protein insertion efficiency factor